jgi:hypothetical protein
MGRVATEAPGDVRLGRRREPPVPAAVGGPRRARFRDERRRPRQPSRGVRRRQQGPPPAAKDPCLPVPEDTGSVTQLSLPQAERFPGHLGTHAIPGDVRAAVVGRAPGRPSGAVAAALVPRPQRPPRAMTGLSQLLSVYGVPPRRHGRRAWCTRTHPGRVTCSTNRRRADVALYWFRLNFPTRNEESVLMGSYGFLECRAELLVVASSHLIGWFVRYDDDAVACLVGFITRSTCVVRSNPPERCVAYWTPWARAS